MDLLAEAIGIAEHYKLTDLVASLRTKRGRAFEVAGMYNDARSELELAFATLPSEAVEQRAQVRIYLAEVSFWLRDTPGMHRNAGEALTLAEAAVMTTLQRKRWPGVLKPIRLMEIFRPAWIATGAP